MKAAGHKDRTETCEGVCASEIGSPFLLFQKEKEEVGKNDRGREDEAVL